MYNDEDLLTTNQYINTDVYDITDDKTKQEEYIRKQSEFRKFMKDKTSDFDTLNHPTNNDKVISQDVIKNRNRNLPSRSFQPSGAVQSAQLSQLDSNIPNNDYMNSNSLDFQVTKKSLLPIHDPSTRFSQDIRTMVSIDSRDRDETFYGDQNHYKIRLRRTFTNVTVVKIKSTEIPNTLQLIRSTPVSQQNNKIYWSNEEDGVDQIYIAQLIPGNYSATTLAAEMAVRMSAVQRVNALLGNPQHFFTVVIDTATDIVAISSINFNTVANPFTTVGTNIVLITYAEHGFSIGDTVIIQNSESVGDIPSSELNGEHIILSTGFTANTFEIAVSSTDSGNVSAGGSLVEIGTGTVFKLLWSNDGTPGDILGYPNVDSPTYEYIQTNTVVVSTIQINEIIFFTSIQAEVITVTNHGFASGDRINITGYTHLYGAVNPGGTAGDLVISIAANVNGASGHIITVTAPDRFLIPVAITGPTYGAQLAGTIGETDIYGFATIRNLNSAINLTGENYIYIVSPQLPSMITTNDLVPVAFYKIQLSGAAGNVVFNTFVGNPMVFYDTPLPFLDEIEFFFVNPDGTLFNFNDFDHSFTIEIVETIQKLEKTGESSQIGIFT